MSDEPKKSDAFRPQDPYIPGVTDNPKRAKEAEKLRKIAEKAQRSATSTPSALASPTLWAAIVGVFLLVTLAYFGVKWWENQRALKQAENPPVAAGHYRFAEHQHRGGGFALRTGSRRNYCRAIEGMVVQEIHFPAAANGGQHSCAGRQASEQRLLGSISAGTLRHLPDGIRDGHEETDRGV